MYQIVHDIMRRQRQALRLLHELLREEYALLLAGDSAAVVALEFSIHELIRQLAAEKSSVIRLLGGGKVTNYAELLPSEQGETLRVLYDEIDAEEQAASRQASRNAEFSRLMLEQNEMLMRELHKHLLPPVEQTYGKKGSVDGSHRPRPSIITGRT